MNGVDTAEQAKTTIVPVIMCGGSGTRLWPASTPAHPKQFIALTGELSCFQQTMLRARALWPDATPLIVAGTAHVALIEQQLAGIGADADLLIEPQPRDSAPAIAAAAIRIADRDPLAVAFVLASDHHIGDVAGFAQAAASAIEIAREGWLVTLGLTPTEPATSYGYIRPGAPLKGGFQVAAFVEKPDRETAQRHRADGYLWNSGMFVAQARTLVGEIERHVPDIATAVREALDGAQTAGIATVMGAAFATAPKISIDYAVMEKTDRAAVVPGDFGWSDLGAWNAVWQVSPRDASGNAATGDTVLRDAADNLVRAASGMTVAVIGARHLAIVAERDAVLVCDLAASQDVKAVAEAVKGRPASQAGDGDGNAADLMLWLKGSALPLWWAIGADPHGGFFEALDHAGEPVEKPRRARVQTRQVYVYAMAGQLGWRGPWRQAAEHGMAFFLRHYRRSDGLFRTMVAADGACVDDTPKLYDQAFALFAMAALYRAAPDRTDLKHEAESLLEALRARMRHPVRGFVEQAEHAGQSNPHMHLLEAALAWVEADGSSLWRGLADEIAMLCLDRFIDPDGGFVREYFGSDWRPSDGDAGRLVEPGHQFEWAWLLDKWSRLQGRNDAAAAIPRLIAQGRKGIDPLRGVVMNCVGDDGRVRDANARLWPQCEWLKAARVAGDTIEMQRAARAIRSYLVMPVPGLWRDVCRPDGTFVDEPAPASSLYHLVGAICELTSGR